jgi:hypothetical protein
MIQFALRFRKMAQMDAEMMFQEERLGINVTNYTFGEDAGRNRAILLQS